MPPLPPPLAMTSEERYLFDLNGYLVRPRALSPDEVAALCALLDRHRSRLRDRADSLAGGAPRLRGGHRRAELEALSVGCGPENRPFWRLLVHPAVTPVLTSLLGRGFRLDHSPLFLVMRRDTEGMLLHGGGGPEFDPSTFYLFRNDQMHCGLVAVEWFLSAVRPGDGGLCVVPGSHKSNYRCPESLRRLEAMTGAVHAVTGEAGDLVVFSEGLTHGTLPWTGDEERLVLLLRYAPANAAYARDYAPAWHGLETALLDPDVRSLFEPPYHLRLERPTLDGRRDDTWK